MKGIMDLMRIGFKAALIFCMVSLTIAIAYAEDSMLAKLFTERKVKGTIIISSLDGKTEFVYNEERAGKRFLPASTFKIPNTLIALDEKAITNEMEIIKWDGKDKGWHPWNKDQTLETAFPLSCVWFYQELAKRVGNIKYRSHLKKLNYGNKKTGPELSTFWLDGDLKISAREQIDFLKFVHREELSYKKRHIQILKKIMIVEKSPQFTIRAKTGWAMRLANQHGWYVGYVETDQNVWFFSTNIDIQKKSDADYRKEITMDALKKKGVI